MLLDLPLVHSSAISSAYFCSYHTIWGCTAPHHYLSLAFYHVIWELHSFSNDADSLSLVPLAMLLQVIPWDIPLVLSAAIPSSGADPLGILSDILLDLLPSDFTLVIPSDHPFDIPPQTHLDIIASDPVDVFLL